MSNTLKFGNGNWATKEGSTLAYNDENNNFKPLPFSFERDSSATVVNKDGLIEVVGAGMPRIDYKDNSEGALLLEPQSTNLITHSSELTNSSWVKTNTGTGSAPSITSNYSISPDGTQNADRVIFNLNGGTANGDISQVSVTIGSVSSASYTNSVYIKSNTSNNYDLVVTDPSGGHIIKNISTEWQRFDNPRESVTNASFRIRLRGDEGTSDYADVSIWGAQIEEGSYATSYIPTSGSTVTRLADSCSQTTPSGVIGQTEGTLFVDVDFLTFSGFDYFGLNDGSNNERVLIQRSGTNIKTYINSTEIDSQSLSSLSNKIAVSYKANEYKFYLNGTKIATNTSSSVTPSGLNTFEFELGGGFGLFAYLKTKDARVYNTVLTDEELVALTS